ncbi:hypothetical protein PR202_gb23371 [Eleusine coracana subsp. coracana]|uniref:Uncharacterized protein n=1 Tax=Eleusine coracana subsp. coracana TaxID=191504 RepID=A0AAV5FIP5_ELECO|nr:hypothetical protein PR202_gb23371 [Eleusine coracana subsp. coracana]
MEAGAAAGRPPCGCSVTRTRTRGTWATSGGRSRTPGTTHTARPSPADPPDASPTAESSPTSSVLKYLLCFSTTIVEFLLLPKPNHILSKKKKKKSQTTWRGGRRVNPCTAAAAALYYHQNRASRAQGRSKYVSLVRSEQPSRGAARWGLQGNRAQSGVGPSPFLLALMVLPLVWLGCQSIFPFLYCTRMGAGCCRGSHTWFWLTVWLQSFATAVVNESSIVYVC